jgi:hypothetical protein
MNLEEEGYDLEEEGYEDGLFSGLDNTRRIIKDVLHCNGVKDVKIYNTLCVATEGSRSTGGDVRDALAVMWGRTPFIPPGNVTALWESTLMRS